MFMNQVFQAVVASLWVTSSPGFEGIYRPYLQIYKSVNLLNSEEEVEEEEEDYAFSTCR